MCWFILLSTTLGLAFLGSIWHKAQYGLYISLATWYTICIVEMSAFFGLMSWTVSCKKTLFDLISFIFRGVGARSVVPSPHFGRPSLWSILLIGKTEWRTRRVIYYQCGLVKMETSPIAPITCKELCCLFHQGVEYQDDNQGTGAVHHVPMPCCLLWVMNHENSFCWLNISVILLSIASSFYRLSVSTIFSSIAISLLIAVSFLFLVKVPV